MYITENDKLYETILKSHITNKNVNIEFSAHERRVSGETFIIIIIKTLESQVTKKSLETSKQKGLNRIARHRL